jgi:ubiquitin-protein ligase
MNFVIIDNKTILIMSAMKRLMQEYKQITEDPVEFCSIGIPNPDDLFKWNFVIIGPEESIFEFGLFTGVIIFSKQYPNDPPKVIFERDYYHPNIYKNGEVCISILHKGVDFTGYEDSSLRWKPNHGVNTIMASIYSLFMNINLDSPANIDAARLYKENFDEYKKKVYSIISSL